MIGQKAHNTVICSLLYFLILVVNRAKQKNWVWKTASEPLVGFNLRVPKLATLECWLTDKTKNSLLPPLIYYAYVHLFVFSSLIGRKQFWNSVYDVFLNKNKQNLNPGAHIYNQSINLCTKSYMCIYKKCICLYTSLIFISSRKIFGRVQ